MLRLGRIRSCTLALSNRSWRILAADVSSAGSAAAAWRRAERAAGERLGASGGSAGTAGYLRGPHSRGRRPTLSCGSQCVSQLPPCETHCLPKLHTTFCTVNHSRLCALPCHIRGAMSVIAVLGNALTAFQPRLQVLQRPAQPLSRRLQHQRQSQNPGMRSWRDLSSACFTYMQRASR